ncbi:MAG: 16S rRNA (cytosine(1402)-N(4))-methyltransferase RsmH [Verrucomicrobia bacterium]|nr:16S rRNA (cytosine(1402)-N(4))-methyltransferase RsmH [Verrucomicrobiota bacterium]
MLCSLDETQPAAAPGHCSVLLDASVALLAPVEGSRFLDGTFGGGGHTEALLKSANDVTVVALDRDPAAVQRAESLKAQYGEHFIFHAMNFGALAELEAGAFDGILFDFGLSSFQLDDAERGFSFRHDAPADMRMDPHSGQSAAAFLESASEEKLVEAIRNFGEEKRWRRVVAAIMEARGSGSLERTQSLAALIGEAVGPGPRGRSKVHPATRSFQGIRIAVNDELGAIERALPAAFERLRAGGVLVAISFHSLEDRIVKRFCRRMAGRPEHANDSRTLDERAERARMLSTRAIAPSEVEIKNNPRSRSARMRALRKL